MPSMVRSDTDSVVKAEIFKIIKANMYKKPKEILKLLRERLPDVPINVIVQHLEYIIGEREHDEQS